MAIVEGASDDDGMIGELGRNSERAQQLANIVTRLRQLHELGAAVSSLTSSGDARLSVERR